MPRKFFSKIFEGICAHEFAWPRRSDDGEYYQVCVLCGDKYRYDWESMCRAERIENPAQTSGKPAHGLARASTKKPSWHPRARRLRASLAVDYRAWGTQPWFSGTIENISQSGLLIRGETCPEQGAKLEMIFEMPPEISGQNHSWVLANGQVTRLVAAKPNAFHLLAAAIRDYKFLHWENEQDMNVALHPELFHGRAAAARAANCRSPRPRRNLGKAADRS